MGKSLEEVDQTSLRIPTTTLNVHDEGNLLLRSSTLHAALAVAPGSARASSAAQWLRTCLSVQEMWVRSLGREDALEKGTATSVLAWRTPWAEEPGGLQSMGLQRTRRN